MRRVIEVGSSLSWFGFKKSSRLMVVDMVDGGVMEDCDDIDVVSVLRFLSCVQDTFLYGNNCDYIDLRYPPKYLCLSTLML